MSRSCAVNTNSRAVHPGLGRDTLAAGTVRDMSCWQPALVQGRLVFRMGWPGRSRRRSFSALTVTQQEGGNAQVPRKDAQDDALAYVARTPPRPTWVGGAVLWHASSSAGRPFRAGTRPERTAPQPHPGRHDHPLRALQEAPLGRRRSYVLPIARQNWVQPAAVRLIEQGDHSDRVCDRVLVRHAGLRRLASSGVRIAVISDRTTRNGTGIGGAEIHALFILVSAAIPI